MRPFFFEAECQGTIIAFTFVAKTLIEANVIAQAYLAGMNTNPDNLPFQLTSATAYKRRGVTYSEVF